MFYCTSSKHIGLDERNIRNARFTLYACNHDIPQMLEYVTITLINFCIFVIFQCRQAPIRQCGNVPREQCTQIPRYNCKKVSFLLFAYQIAKKRCLDCYGSSDILFVFLKDKQN